jgi:mono/diheme cytochrome c family protein
MTSAIKETLLITVFAMVAIGIWTDNAVAQSISPAPFTRAQSDAGRLTYVTSCASCHGDGLEGKGSPALAGKAFIASNFGQHTVADLYSFIQKSMPFCDGGTLAAESYTDIVAFILEANGAKSGDQPLTPAASVKVSDIATGDMPAGFLSGVTPK